MREGVPTNWTANRNISSKGSGDVVRLHTATPEGTREACYDFPDELDKPSCNHAHHIAEVL